MSQEQLLDTSVLSDGPSEEKQTICQVTDKILGYLAVVNELHEIFTLISQFTCPFHYHKNSPAIREGNVVSLLRNIEHDHVYRLADMIGADKKDHRLPCITVSRLLLKKYPIREIIDYLFHHGVSNGDEERVLYHLRRRHDVVFSLISVHHNNQNCDVSFPNHSHVLACCRTCNDKYWEEVTLRFPPKKVMVFVGKSQH